MGAQEILADPIRCTQTQHDAFQHYLFWRQYLKASDRLKISGPGCLDISIKIRIVPIPFTIKDSNVRLNCHHKECNFLKQPFPWTSYGAVQDTRGRNFTKAKSRFVNIP